VEISIGTIKTADKIKLIKGPNVGDKIYRKLLKNQSTN
jgi:hypothetical protein